MSATNKTIRQSIREKTRRLSCNRMLVERIENGIEAEERKHSELLVEKFREAADPEEAKRLGDKLGLMVFGGG